MPPQAAPVIYCVVPPRFAELEPRLAEHFEDDTNVAVIVDRRVGERRRHEPAPGSSPDAGGDRRAIDGRRTSVPARTRPPLPADLRGFEGEVRFRAAGDRGWRRRCLDAEHQAGALASALESAADALRSRRGLSPRRFLQLIRADEAVTRYYRWRAGR